MAKAVFVVASALCLLVLVGPAFGHVELPTSESFLIEGKVYCDTCRVLFATNLSHPIQGAKVELECIGIDAGQESTKKTAITDESGHYELEVEGDHEEDICTVKVVSSPDSDCNEVVPEISRSIISITTNSGMEGFIRQANPIGFRRKSAIKGCIELLDGMEFVPLKSDSKFIPEMTMHSDDFTA
ncbi:hypothetical protein NMG60_11003354 [Bertholletia excelsa]